MFNLGDFPMKKTLVALASMAALGAFAQSSVTMYGIAEATVDLAYKSTLDSSSQTRVGTVVTNSAVVNTTTKAGFRVQDGNSQGTGTSRIGWRGTEDLGGGLKANFQLEMGIRIDDGATTTPGVTNTNSGDSGGNTFGRNAWVGASGGFGEIRLGRQVLGSFATQAGGWSAGSSNGLYDAGSSTAPAMGGVRFSNAIRYITPNLGGFTGSVMLSAPESTLSTNNGVAGAGNTTSTAKPKTGFDLALDYANGPLYVGFGYNSRGASASATTGAPSSVAANSSIKAYTLSAAYDLGVVKPYFNYTRQKTNLNGATSVGPVSFNDDTVEKAFQLGVRAPIGAATHISGYGNSKLTFASATALTATTATGTAVEGKEKAFQIGLQYPLSKRTLIETNYGQYKHNQNGATTNVAAGPLGPVVTGGSLVTASQKVNAFNVGLRHTF